MPPLILAGAALGTWLVGMGLFAWQSARESHAYQSRIKELASVRIAALAKRRGTWVAFYATGGKGTAGRIVEMDTELLIVYLDVRKQTRSADNPGAFEFPEDVPKPNDLAAVDITEIDYIEVYDE